MKKGLLIYNAKSGNNKVVKNLDLIIEKFQKNNIHLHIIRVEKDTTKLEKTIKDRKYDFAVIAGGDGTINISLNIFLNNGIDVPLGIIPGGTSNDLARCLDMPRKIEDAIDVIIKGRTKRIDVGLINKKKYFLTTFGGGLFMGAAFDPKIIELKKKFGRLAYLLKGIAEMINVKSFPLVIETDKGIIAEESLLFLIMTGKHAAGFSNIIDTADLSDGLMEVLIVKKCNHIEISKSFLNFTSGLSEEDRNIKVIKTSRCSIKSITKDISITYDGEEGKSVPTDIELLKEKLEVFIK